MTSYWSKSIKTLTLMKRSLNFCVSSSAVGGFCLDLGVQVIYSQYGEKPLADFTYQCRLNLRSFSDRRQNVSVERSDRERHQICDVSTLFLSVSTRVFMLS